MSFVLLGLIGCKVVDAPENLEELAVFGFVNFDEPDRFLEATEDELLSAVTRNEEELLAGYRINNLSNADLAAAGIEEAKDLTGILGFMGIADYTHGLDAVIEATSATDKNARWPDKWKEFAIEETTDRPCFLAEDCERLDQIVFEVANVPTLGDAERTFDAAFRWIDSADGPRSVFIRQLTPDGIEFSGSLISATTHQQYSFAMVYEEEDGHARRLEAFWVDFELLGQPVPDAIAIGTAISEMQNQAEKIDTWIDENG